MKLLLILLLLPFMVQAQSPPPIGAGLTAGYSSKNTLVGEFYVAARMGQLRLFPVNFKLHASREQDVPQIISTRAGYSFGTTTVYGEWGYHFAGSIEDKHGTMINYSGWKPGGGIIQHFGGRVVGILGLSGNVVSGTIGIYGFH